MATKKIILGMVICLLIVSLTSLVLANSRIFEVEETDFIRLRTDGYDPDDDQISYTYSLPLNEKGEWQTTYNDAGEYVIEIKASDGKEEITETATLIVKNKNQPPRLTENKIVVKETQTADLKVLVEEPDDDPLRFVFTEPFDQSGKWSTEFDDAGVYLIDFTASDGEFIEEFHVGIEVVNTDKPMQILNLFSEPAIEIAEGETLVYWVEVKPGEGKGEVQYRWELNEQLISESLSGEYYFNFDTAGEYFLKLAIKQNGQEIIKEWDIQVTNTNQAPELLFLPITIKEGEKIVLNLPKEDYDGDTLSYSIDSPFVEGKWQTDFFDAGKHNIRITASDGELVGEGILEVTVLNVDHAPSLNLPRTVELWEGQESKLIIETDDPDNDKLKISFENLPEGTIFDEESKTLTFIPSYDTIKRSGSRFSNFLNSLRLERFLLSKTITHSKVISCGVEFCSAAKIRVVINNVNQVPVFETLDQNATLSALETEEFFLSLEAADPDGDILNYYYSTPLGRTTGKWKTDYGDAGIYQVNITATDGKEKTTLPVSIEILKNNRAPSVKVKKDKFTVNEGQEFSFEVKAADPDEDELSISLENYFSGVSFNQGVFVWQPDFEIVENRTRTAINDLISSSSLLNRRFSRDKETVWLNFIVDDGNIKTEHPVKVTIKNVNQAPELIDYMPAQEIKVKVGEPVLFHLAVKDVDNDQLQYDWSFGFGQGKVKGTDTVKRVFQTPGKKKVKVEVSDGLETIEHRWVVEVEGISKASDQIIGSPTSLEPAAFKVYVLQH